ncbi:MAG: right-handed parallel beta-helix repeat-containing protein [Candidatus Omnitrophica bacterium]|nr:right-handed parallel beta-helix repeat-containing protein [Candidatus Omnitrophota bacterium]
MSIHRVTILLLALSLPAHAATLHVSPDGTAADGLTWQTGFPTIGEAIVASSTGDEVWVRSATYVENVTIEQPITLLGGFAGNEDRASERDWTANVTVLQASAFGPVIRIEGTSQCVVDGLHLTGGLGEEGAGFSIRNSSVEVANCTVFDNRAASTGFHCSGGGIGVIDSFVRISRTFIYNNDGCLGGGGLVCIDAVVEIENCKFFGNRASSGGAVAIGESRVLIQGSTLEVNLARYDGAVACSESNLIIRNTRIASNVASERTTSKIIEGGPIPPTTAFNSGAAIGASRSSVTVENCVLENNRSQLDQGCYIGDSKTNAVFRNCTIVGSGSFPPAIAWSDSASAPTLLNCILVGPGILRYGQGYDDPEAEVSYSNLEGNYPGKGNINVDSKFVDSANGDYHLESDSPCINSGTDTGLTTDFDGNPRPIGRYDMGAFEFPLFRSDLNGDGEVGPEDLMILQSDWGKVSGP